MKILKKIFIVLILTGAVIQNGSASDGTPATDTSIDDDSDASTSPASRDEEKLKRKKHRTEEITHLEPAYAAYLEMAQELFDTSLTTKMDLVSSEMIQASQQETIRLNSSMRTLTATHEAVITQRYAETATALSSFLNNNPSLIFSILREQPEVIETLCKNHSTIMAACSSVCDEDGYTPLARVICANNFDLARALATVTDLTIPLTINGKITRYTHLACLSSTLEMFQVIVEAAANKQDKNIFSLKNFADLTVAQTAITQNKFEHLKILTQHAAMLPLTDLIDYTATIINNSLFADTPNPDAFKFLDLLLKAARTSGALNATAKPLKNIKNKKAQQYIIDQYKNSTDVEAQGLARILEESLQEHVSTWNRVVNLFSRKK